MKAYIINLSKDKIRREFQEKQLSNLGIDYEIVNAVTTDDIELSVYKNHENDWQRPLRRVEVACYFSHRTLWKKIIERKEPALILEDDALLSQCVPNILNDLSTLDNIDYVTLEVRGRKKLVANEGQDIAPSSQARISRIYRLYLDRTGAAGYVLFPSGASKLLEQEAENGIGLADAHITACYDLVAYQIEPAAIIQVDQCAHYGIRSPLVVKSNISNQDKPPMTFRKKFFFKVKRIKAQIRQGLQQIRHFFHATRRDIKIDSEDFKIAS